MSDYQQGYDDGRSQHYSNQAMQKMAASLGTMFTALAVLSCKLLMGFMLASPFLLLGFLVASPFHWLGAQFSLGRWLVVGPVGYLGFAALYWLKGVVVALGRRGGWRWLLPLAVCIGVSCLLPALAVKNLVLHSFPTAGAAWGWGLAAAFGLFAYKRYGFTQDTAPALTLWSYRRGYQWGNK